jgi:CCR4-NOT transcription complex subunit 1
MQISEAQLNQAWFQIKDLLVCCFKFLKHNMVVGQQATPALQAFYTATIRIVLIILKDYPEFLCEFHFSFVNALPDHAI